MELESYIHIDTSITDDDDALLAEVLQAIKGSLITAKMMHPDKHWLPMTIKVMPFDKD